MNDLDQFFRRGGAWIVARCRGVDDVFEDVVLDDLGDESVKRPPAGFRLLQNRGT